MSKTPAGCAHSRVVRKAVKVGAGPGVKSTWRCEDCDTEFAPAITDIILENLKAELRRSKDYIRSCEAWMDDERKDLWKRSYVKVIGDTGYEDLGAAAAMIAADEAIGALEMRFPMPKRKDNDDQGSQDHSD